MASRRKTARRQYTEEVINRAFELYLHSVPIDTICEVLNIGSKSTVHGWIEKRGWAKEREKIEREAAEVVRARAHDSLIEENDTVLKLTRAVYGKIASELNTGENTPKDLAFLAKALDTMRRVRGDILTPKSGEDGEDGGDKWSEVVFEAKDE